ncbi:acetyltransferase [Lutibacter maritimus]|uniref:Sugar O-acyltransferase, sialic acid O-acetyltransferase NeuD family n=1 Tax=Lutibacter maritimus TaxID=593133 RepID=A0A1I6QN57_9FLAO|nr:acetyltransferase [Lutibacter maritimus]SFS53748.1 sugar O-acyltransferase, sialic acid O-acetyltransferase NeuD family [Lutibacter maritimus]
MLIIGAKGFAKEVLEVLHQQNKLQNIAFYDDVNSDIGDTLYNTFPILKSEKEVKHYFKTISNQFTIGIGNPVLRYKMKLKFEKLQGELKSCISPFSNIGNYDVNIGIGTIVMNGVNISNSTSIGSGCIVYYNSNITHDCIVGDFVEISPSVNLLGNVKVGEFTQIGSNTTILPNITIGKNVIIGAGSVVTKNVPDNTMVIGIPAKIVKQLEPLDI